MRGLFMKTEGQAAVRAQSSRPEVMSAAPIRDKIGRIKWRGRAPAA